MLDNLLTLWAAVVARKISFSEITTLARCEQQWAYKYMDRLEDPSGLAAQKGTLFHDFLARWWSGWFVDHTDLFSDEAIDAVDFTDEDQSKMFDDAEWLALRYIKNYGYGPDPSIEVIAIEQEIFMPVTSHGASFVLHCFIDRLVRDEYGNLWVVEDKTYGNRQRLEMLNIDLQLTLYVIAAEWFFGEPVFGVLFNGAYTYRWKPEKPTQGLLISQRIAEDPAFHQWTKAAQTTWAREAVTLHPGTDRAPSESFDREYVDRSDVAKTVALDIAARAVDRRGDLRAVRIGLEPRLPTLNLGGQSCGFCSFKAQCWDRVSGGDLIEIELVEA